MMRKKLLLVYNPVSGTGGIISSLADVISAFTAAGYDVTAHPTSQQGDGKLFIEQYADNYDLVCSCGGDGMLHELFCGMKGHRGKCGYIPSGTVNDFASSMRIPKNIPEAVKMIIEENYRNIDAGEMNGNRFAYIAAFGVFTEVSYSTSHNLKSVLGSFAYFLEGVKRFDPFYFSEKSANLKITCNDYIYEGEFSFGMAGNTLSVAGSTLAVPSDASMDDGLLDFLFIRTPKTLADYDKIRIALTNEDKPCDSVIRLKASSLKLESEKPIDWDLDGEFGGSFLTAEFSVDKQAITIAAPEKV